MAMHDDAIEWDEEADVVVVGYGNAGGISAIVAADAGADVLLVEKRRHPGGISILAGGGVAFARDADAAFQYLQRTCNGRTPDDILRVMADEMTSIVGWLEELAKVSGTEPLENNTHAPGGTYPFPGTHSLSSVKLREFDAYSEFPWAHGLRGGARLFKVIYDNVNKRGIRVMLQTPAEELITNRDGDIVGIIGKRDGALIHIKARQGVVLACGGFENDDVMKAHFLEAQPAYPIYRGNTGDGIRMAQQAGAALWHMWHVHGGYGFKFPELPFAIRHVWSGPRNENRKMIWIAVDQFGKRFMDEYLPAPQDVGMRALEFFDADIQAFPRIPCYLIFDEEGRKLGPIGIPIVNDEPDVVPWSEDNMAEVEKGWIKRGANLEEIAAEIGVSSVALQDSVDRWNASCAEREDKDFRRPPGTMMPIRVPPYYCIEAWPVVNNTQGGPEHDAKQRVLDPMKRPIRRLYVAGEISSIYGFLYQEGGNITECFVAGKIAGTNAAREEHWD